MYDKFYYYAHVKLRRIKPFEADVIAVAAAAAAAAAADDDDDDNDDDDDDDVDDDEPPNTTSITQKQRRDDYRVHKIIKLSQINCIAVMRITSITFHKQT